MRPLLKEYLVLKIAHSLKLKQFKLSQIFQWESIKAMVGAIM